TLNVVMRILRVDRSPSTPAEDQRSDARTLTSTPVAAARACQEHCAATCISQEAGRGPGQERAVEKIVPEEKAKQGRRGKRVLMILIIGLLLAAAVWAVVEYSIPGNDELPPAASENTR